MTNSKTITDFKINVKLKLALLWTSLMFLYIYADFFHLMIPGKIESLMNQRSSIGEITPMTLLIFSLILLVPAAMIFLSIFLRPIINKWLNIVVAIIWSSMSFIIIVWDAGDIGGWYTFYFLYQVVEVIILGMIVWSAWKWPIKNEVLEK